MTERYFINCRGLNYVPAMETEWKNSGYLPRYNKDYLPAPYKHLGYDGSASFYGSCKTSMWWYYNHDDNLAQLGYLKSIGINALRVFLDFYVWYKDRDRFFDAVRDFLFLADKYKIRVQFVIWDGINIGSPYTHVAGDEVSGVQVGMSGWQFNPWPNHVTLSFLTASGFPYIRDVIQTCSSFQSFWSIDVLNEGNLLLALSPTLEGDAFLQSSVIYTKSVLSSVPNTMVTIGNAALTDSFVDIGTANPHGFPDGYQDEYEPLSSVLDVLTCHPYVINQIDRDFISVVVASASNYWGLPIMGNESTAPTWNNPFFNDVFGFSSIGLGNMAWQACIDNPFSIQPFKDSHGIFYGDGQCRRIEDVSAYRIKTLGDGWIRQKQLNYRITQKEDSVNGGVDGGFTSSIPPQLSEFNQELYVSADETTWEALKSFLLASYCFMYKGSKNFAPIQGHNLSWGYRGYMGDVASSNEYSFIYNIKNWNSKFGYLSAYDDSDYGVGQKNIQSYKMQQTLEKVTIALSYCRQLMFTPQLSGTVYDKSIIPTPLQYEVSSLYDAIQFSDTSVSNITPYYVDPYGCSNVGATICSRHVGGGFTEGACIYVTPGVSSTGINWAAYDTYYSTYKDKLLSCINILEASGFRFTT